MEKETLVIKDSKREEELVIDSSHIYFEKIKDSMMPDEYRNLIRNNNDYKYTDLAREEIEEEIKAYYDVIENPFFEGDEIKEISKTFFPLGTERPIWDRWGNKWL